MPEISFIPFPERNTDRLFLRSLSMNDAPEVFVLRSHPLIQKYIMRPPALSIEDAEQFIEKVLNNLRTGEAIQWGMVLKGQQKLIGSICLWNINYLASVAEVGYNLHPDYFGKGLMSEALNSVIDFGFNIMKLARIDAYTNKANQASLTLLERHNFARNFSFEATYEDKKELEYNVIYSLYNS